jgi:HEAT repeat protein
MLGWSNVPPCPIPTAEKVWIECRLRWLGGAFGPKRLLDARVIEPTLAFFPEPYDESREAAQVVFGQVCDYMSVPRERVRLEFLDDEKAWQLGDYTRSEQERIRLHERTFAEPMQLAATCAHELAHVLLLGDERISEQAADHEPTTDLLMVYLGLGVIAANAAVQSAPGGHAYRQGYMYEREFGYALALFAWLRGENKPTWAAELRPTARRVMNDGLDFLLGGGDCLIDPGEFKQRLGDLVPATLPQLIGDLASPWPGRRLAALWELGRSPEACAEAATAVAPLARDPDVDVRRQAAFTLALAGPSSAAACAALLDATLDDNEPQQLAAVAWSLGRLQAPDPDCPRTLLKLLRDPAAEVRAEAAHALHAYAKSLSERDVDRLCDLALEDPALEVREETLATLAELPEAALLRILPQLLLVFEEPERVLFGAALRVLARLGPGAREVEPQIRTLLRRGDPFSRAAAALALARIAGRPADAVRALRHTRPLPVDRAGICSEDYVPAILASVQATLRDLGPAALDGLMAALSGRTLADNTVFAVWGLGQVGPLPDQARLRLAEMCHHASPLVRFLAALARGQIVGPTDPAVPVWLEMIGGRPSPGRYPTDITECFGMAAADILHEIGTPLAPAVFDLLRRENLPNSRAYTNLLGELAAASNDVRERLLLEHAVATGVLRDRLDAAAKRQIAAAEAERTKKQRCLSFPPTLNDGDDEPDPIDTAMDRFWGWLAEVTLKPHEPSGTVANSF